jgi:hypothetical protein
VRPVVEPVPPPDPSHIQQHLRDRPRFCGMCGASYEQGLVVEYWYDRDRVFHCWCRSCKESVEIVSSNRVVGVEPEH